MHPGFQSPPSPPLMPRPFLPACPQVMKRRRMAFLQGLQEEQLVAVQEEQLEEEAEERKSPEEADPLLNPKEEKSFFISRLPQREQHSAASDMLRAKYSKVSPQSPHLYS